MLRVKKIISLFLLIVMVTALLPGFAEANQPRQPVFGQARVSGGTVIIPVTSGGGGAVNYTLSKDGSIIHEGTGSSNGREVHLPMPSGLSSGLYEITVWFADGNLAGAMSSQEVRLTGGGGGSTGAGQLFVGRSGAPGATCRASIRAILAPSAVLYSGSDMSNPLMTLSRYDRVIVHGGSGLRLYVTAVVATSSTTTSIGPPAAPIVSGTQTRPDSAYRSIAGATVTQTGWIYAYTTRHNLHRENDEIIQDVIEVALSRRGFHGIYNQSLRHSIWYLDCSAFVDWVYRVNGVNIPGGTAAGLTESMVGANVNVYSIHDAMGQLIDWGVDPLPEHDPSLVRNLKIGSWTIEEVHAMTEGDWDGLYMFDESKIVGSQDDVEAGDTVSIGQRPVSMIATWENYRPFHRPWRCNPPASSTTPCSGPTCRFRSPGYVVTIPGSGQSSTAGSYYCGWRWENDWEEAHNASGRAEITTYRITNDRFLGITHIGLQIGDGFTIDDAGGGRDRMVTGYDFIHSTSPVVRLERDYVSRRSARVVHIGRPIDHQGFRYQP